MNHYYHYTMPYCPSLNVGIEVYRRRNPRVVVCRDLMAFPIYWSSLGASLKKQKTTILVHVLRITYSGSGSDIWRSVSLYLHCSSQQNEK
jgi:hypothetical protein